jgi:hypothetical protein
VGEQDEGFRKRFFINEDCMSYQVIAMQFLLSRTNMAQIKATMMEDEGVQNH